MAETEYLKGTLSLGCDNRMRLQKPLLLTNPAITGTPAVGLLLTAAVGTYRAGATVGAPNYQWYRNGKPIVGQIASTYTVAAADVGQKIRCQIWLFYATFKKKWFSNIMIGTP